MSDEFIREVEIAGHIVVIAYDADACVWYIHGSTVPGLAGEGPSPEALVAELQVTVRSLALP